MEYTENKGRLRSPFKAGTKIDVILRAPIGTAINGPGEVSRLDDHRLQILGTVSGNAGINDWQLDGLTGDVLAYRLHEEETA